MVGQVLPAASAQQPAHTGAAGRHAHSIWQVEVVESRRIAPRMQRITVAGPDVRRMPEGPNIKLFIPPRGVSAVEAPTFDTRGHPVWSSAANRPAIRTYSVRRLDRERCRLEIDFVLHDHHGPASSWAAQARPGAGLVVGGPGGRDVRPASNYVLAGDLSALPAIAHLLEEFPQTASGSVFLEAPDVADRIPLVHPAGFRVEWLTAPAVGSALPAAIRERVDWKSNPDTFLWVGGESDAVREIRAYGRDELRLDRRMILAIGYWKRGMSEDGYHEAHDNDRDADYHAVWLEERMRKAANG